MKKTLESLTRWLSSKRVGIPLMVLAFTLGVRLASLTMVKNPDAIAKWHVARAFLNGEPPLAFAFDHHAARWGINLPILLVQSVLGEAAWVYYVPILLFALLQAYLTLRIATLLAGQGAGVLAVVLYSPLPAMSYVGSHLMPSVFESCYALMALWALLRSFEDQRLRFIVVSCACFSAGYLAKETIVFFLPGLFVAVYLARRRFLDVFGYAGGFGAVIGVETLIYRLTYGFELGRVSIISRHHLGNAKMKPPIESVWQLLERYLELSFGFRELFYGALLASMLLLVFGRRLQLDRRKTASLLAVCWAFFLMSTFALKSLDPPRIAQPPNQRYLFAAAPFLAIILAVTLRAALPAAIVDRFRARLPSATAASLSLVFGSVLFARLGSPSEHPLALLPRYERQVRTAFESGVPIIGTDHKRNAIGTVVGLLLSFEQEKRVRFVYPKLKGKKARVVLDRSHSRFKKLSKRTLTQLAKNYRERPHLEVTSNERPFTVTRPHTGRTALADTAR